ncbi:MAG: hypothetical protein IJD22_00140 [Clostridia bacterium]|nr:hypothetical protein [Clostridia bacterium]
MNRPCVRLASLALIAAFLFTLAPFSVVADSESSPLAVSLDIFNKDLWISSDGVFDISVTDTDERRSVSVSAERNTRSMTFGVRIPETDLSLYNELAITFALIGDDTGHTVSVFAKGTSGSHKEEIKLTSGEKTLYLPLETGTLTDISFTVSASESEGSLGYFTLTDISADNGYTYYYSRLFGATDLYSENKHEKIGAASPLPPKAAHSPFMPILKATSLQKRTFSPISLSAAALPREAYVPVSRTATAPSTKQTSAP